MHFSQFCVSREHQQIHMVSLCTNYVCKYISHISQLHTCITHVCNYMTFLVLVDHLITSGINKNQAAGHTCERFLLLEFI